MFSPKCCFVFLTTYDRMLAHFNSAVSVAIRFPSTGMWHQVLSTLFSRGHAIRRRWCEMCAPILDQPLIAVAGGYVEKVDRDRGDDRSIRTVGIAHGKECI